MATKFGSGTRTDNLFSLIKTKDDQRISKYVSAVLRSECTRDWSVLIRERVTGIT